METRFHPSEIEALDDYARSLDLSHEEALQEALRRQAARITFKKPLSFWARRRLGLQLPPPSLDQIVVSTIVADLYDSDLARLASDYKKRSGCRTQFAVPRHALAAELKERGLTSSEPQVGFSATPFV